MPDQPNTIPAAAPVDAGAQPQPQANGTDVPAWAMDLQKRMEGIYRETVEVHKKVRGSEKASAPQPQAQSSSEIEALRQEMAVLRQSARNAELRASAMQRGIPANMIDLVTDAAKGRGVEDVDAFLGEIAGRFQAPAAQVQATPPPAPKPATARPTAPASAAPVIATGSADGQRSGVLSPEALVQARGLPRDEFWKLHEQLIASERGPQIQAVAVKPPRK